MDERLRPIMTIRCRGRRRAASYHPAPAPVPLSPPEWLRVCEAADLLQVGQTSVRDAIRQGVIPAFRIGRHLRIPRTALTARLLQLTDR
ncbi:MAG: helix-turn-helix domain-containing protein [Armatimonadota bacterium]